ncbi:MAG TPA: CBS domain-containing protein [Myxococcaceae bacterium]|jgi:CBS domain-containing protein
MKQAGNRETVVHVPVQVRSTEYAEGEIVQANSACCPLSKTSVPLEQCMGCKRCEGQVTRPDGEASLQCRVPVAVLQGKKTRGDLGKRLRSTPVSEIMTAKVSCVDSEFNLDELAHLFEKKHIRAAPVVDDEGVLHGMVSKSDLVRGHSHEDEDDAFEEGGHFPPNCLGVLVEGIMTTDVAKLLETASLAEAARLFAARGVHHLPVVTKDEVVVGMLSVMDLARWIATQPESLA